MISRASVRFFADAKTETEFCERNIVDAKLENQRIFPYSNSYEKCLWNYEEEKSYWFELGGKDSLLSLINPAEKGEWKAKEAKAPADGSKSCKEKVSREDKDKKITEKESSSEQLLWENIEEKLNHMLE